MPALDAVFHAHRHVVAQVVEAELAVGAVGDIGGIGFGARHHPQLVLVFVGRFALQVDQESFLAVLGARCHLQHAHAQSEQVVDGRHPAGVAPRQVVVDRDQVGAFAGQGVQVQRQGGYQRLALAGAHLGDLALVQGDAADELNIEMAQPDGALAGFPHGGESLGEQVVQRLAVRQPGAELGRLTLQSLFAERLVLRLEAVDLVDDSGEFFNGAPVGVAAKYFYEFLEHVKYYLWGGIIA